ncbi:hypothetical protein CIPAW_03G214100 [Carya illinoinensis]|uniref:Uncharacterized protein n=1 Tax=Carya illinoinensis TaxID=32201 RepID=A0A8T1R7D4_CARIL|nr:hypothetical protein CIPAW_03G214100 [Carya illinoinensis]KAG6662012.1 hypothetical protein CIPAW_03G214100 [Carya illinoinensis]KAG6662013.1 hypothetical protein CIPAW_03G214100 [Carya illinoinensis]
MRSINLEERPFDIFLATFFNKVGVKYVLAVVVGTWKWKLKRVFWTSQQQRLPIM